MVLRSSGLGIRLGGSGLLLPLMSSSSEYKASSKASVGMLVVDASVVAVDDVDSMKASLHLVTNRLKDLVFGLTTLNSM